MGAAELADSSVESAIETVVAVTEPRLGARGGLVGAKVTVETDPPVRSLSPDEARRLATALMRAADRADETDRELVPILKSYADARDRLVGETT